MERNDAEAVRLYQLAADAGHAPSQCNLGRMYELGRGVAASLADAVAWYERAAKNGSKLATEALRRLRGDKSTVDT